MRSSFAFCSASFARPVGSSVSQSLARSPLRSRFSAPSLSLSLPSTTTMFSNTPLLNPVHRPPPAPLDPITKTIVKLQPAHSLRHAHVLRLYDILLHLVSLPPCYSNSVQSLRAWRALTKCSEFELAASFHLGAKVIERSRAEQDDEDDDEDDEEERNWRQGKRAEWLKWNQEGKVDKVDKLNEYVLSLAAAGRARHGLDELERCVSVAPAALLFERKKLPVRASSLLPLP